MLIGTNLFTIGIKNDSTITLQHNKINVIYFHLVIFQRSFFLLPSLWE